MKKKILMPIMALAIMFTAVYNYSLLNNTEMKTDLSFNSLVNIFNVQAEIPQFGDLILLAEFTCSSCTTEYGQSGSKFGCSLAWGTCEFEDYMLICGYGFC